MKFVTSFNDTNLERNPPLNGACLNPARKFSKSEVYRYAQLARCAEARRKSAKVVVKFDGGLDSGDPCEEMFEVTF